MKETLKKALKFALCVLPFLLIAGISIGYYYMGTGMIDTEALGITTGTVMVMTISQTIVYGFAAGFIGYILAEKTGLLKTFLFKKTNLIVAAAAGLLAGFAMFAVEDLVFTKVIPQVDEYYQTYPFSLSYLTCEISYGGVVEELLMRWLLMSLFVLILWKVFAREKDKREIPVWMFVFSNILVATLFAVGHLPATYTLFGEFTPWIIIRCFVINGGIGMIFGRLYRKRGIQYAMIAHALTHVGCDFALFLALKVF